MEVTANTAEEKQSLQDLTDVSEKRTGGGFYLATDPSSLLKAFEKSLGLVQYAVEPLQAQRGGRSPPTELGRTVAVEPPPEVVRLMVPSGIRVPGIGSISHQPVSSGAAVDSST